MGYSWRKGGQSGGGYCNAIATDPRHAGVAVACGDVWGFAATVDGGDNWFPTNLGEAPSRPYGRCAVFSEKYPGRCYVGVGTLKYQNGHGGGFLGMINPLTDTPYSLTRVNTTVSFTSYLPTGGAGDLPRPVGRLLAVDYDEESDTEYLYALTRQGLMRSTDGGATLTPLGLDAPAPLYAWSALSVQPDGWLLASSFRTSDTGGSRVWKITNPRTNPTVTEVTGKPPVVEDIQVVLYEGKRITMIACGPYGVHKYGGSVVLPADSMRHISSIAQGGDGAVWVGNGVGAPDHACVAKSVDGGASWSWVTPQSACSATIAGTSRFWWLAGAWSDMAKGSGYSVSQLAVDSGDPSIVYSAGRAGVWQTRNGGAEWAPCGNGQDGSESNSFASDGTSVWASDTDYKSSRSTDGFVNAVQDTHPPSFQARSLARTMSDGTSVQVSGTRILVDGEDVADDFARSALVNPKDVLVDGEGRIYIALSGGVLVGDPE